MDQPLDIDNDPYFYKKSRLSLREPLNVDGFELSAAQVIEWLRPQVTDERWTKMQRVVSGRRLDFFTVLENVYDRGNISAVMRTAEGFGYIRFHVIEDPTARFKAANRVTRGADKWVDVQTFDAAAASVKALQAQGVKVYATSLDATKDISEIDFSGPSAVVIGNELSGISGEMASLADDLFKIQMSGFSQSFNLSVAAALCFFQVSRVQPQTPISREQQDLLLANYLLRTVDKPNRLIAHLSQQSLRLSE